MPLIGLAIALPVLATGHTVQAINFEYVAPGGGSSLTVAVGDQVTWVASGDPHTVTSGTPGAIDNRFPDRPASEGFLNQGDSFRTTFSAPGTYPYFCEVHFETMTGTVIVSAAATPEPTPQPTPPPTPRATPPPTPAPTPVPTLAATPAASPRAASTPSDTPVPASSPTASPTPSPLASAPSATPTPTGGSGTPTSSDRPDVLPLAIAGLVAAGALRGLVLARRRGGSGSNPAG